MRVGLLFDCDELVAQWLYKEAGWPDFKYDRCVGLIDKENKLRGAILFQHWNGNNVELSYYGKRTLTAGIARSIARYALLAFNPSRATVTTRKKNKGLIRGLQKLGFRLEGMMKCFYGPKDCNRNTGVRLMLFRADIEKLAGITETEAKCL